MEIPGQDLGAISMMTLLERLIEDLVAGSEEGEAVADHRLEGVEVDTEGIAATTMIGAEVATTEEGTETECMF